LPPQLTQRQRGAKDPLVIASRPTTSETRGILMTDRRLFAPITNARRVAVSTIAATLLSATGFSVDRAIAQQPPAAPSRPAAPPRPAAPAPAPPAAQKPPAAPPSQPQAAAPEIPQLFYSPWAKFCGKGDDPGAKEVCFTGKDARTEAGQPLVTAALIEPEGAPKKLFRITLPSPLQLQYGSRIVIDKEQPISGPFVTCFTNGSCIADYEATPELIGKLKKGQMLQIQAINLAAAAITFQLPLSDTSGNSFQKANEGPPTDPKVFEEQQKKLQEDLQKRADELRKKLESQGGTPPR
jgi:invasion protein IalB